MVELTVGGATEPVVVNGGNGDECVGSVLATVQMQRKQILLSSILASRRSGLIGVDGFIGEVVCGS